MKEFEIWSEGYAATGEHGTAFSHGIWPGDTFDDAVRNMIKHMSETERGNDIYSLYQRQERFIECPVSEEHPLGRRLTYVHSIWACRLFDNETDARKSFG
jgi:hypothetical protein